MENQELKSELEKCKNSTFGCINCLWFGTECKNYEKYVPQAAFVDGSASCKEYVYFD
jgi:hypothetical protein